MTADSLSQREEHEFSEMPNDSKEARRPAWIVSIYADSTFRIKFFRHIPRSKRHPAAALLDKTLAAGKVNTARFGPGDCFGRASRREIMVRFNGKSSGVLVPARRGAGPNEETLVGVSGWARAMVRGNPQGGRLPVQHSDERSDGHGEGVDPRGPSIAGVLGDDGPFIAVDCAAMTGALFAAHLFGHVRGAFTGADRSARGYFLRRRWRHAVSRRDRGTGTWNSKASCSAPSRSGGLLRLWAATRKLLLKCLALSPRPIAI